MILLLPLTHVILTLKQYWDHWQCKHTYSVMSYAIIDCFFLLSGQAACALVYQIRDKHSLIPKALKEQMKSLPVHVYLVFQYLCMSLSLLKRCFHSSASLMCNRKMASLIYLLFSTNWRSSVRVVTMIVFVNQMLLLRAGDVERNPGPGKGVHYGEHGKTALKDQ